MSSESPDLGNLESTRFTDAIARFDLVNTEDPNHELVDGVPQPKELVYARRMTARLERLATDATEPVRLAARAQHIRRWTIPRSRYPTGRHGYRQWRTTLASFHAETAREILLEVDYDDVTINHVQALLRKEKLKADPDAQLLEDVICLVFLEHYLEVFAGQHDEAKLIDILRKTWRKMSDRGRHAAFGLELKPELKALVVKAVG